MDWRLAHRSCFHGYFSLWRAAWLDRNGSVRLGFSRWHHRLRISKRGARIADHWLVCIRRIDGIRFVAGASRQIFCGLCDFVSAFDSKRGGLQSEYTFGYIHALMSNQSAAAKPVDRFSFRFAVHVC